MGPAKLLLLLDEGDLVTAEGGYPGGLHAGRTAADHHDVLRLLGRSDVPLVLVAGEAVDAADDYGVNGLDALVADDASADVLEPALFDLVEVLRVGDERAGPVHLIAPALTQGLLG